MTTIELGAAIQRELSRIDGDETMMKRALHALQRIRREQNQELAGQSDREIIAGLQRAFSEWKDVKDGKLQTRPLEELLNKL